MIPGMMNGPDKKMGVAALILAKPKEGEQEDDSKFGLRAAAEDLISAIHGKDVEGVMSALQSFFEMSEESEESEDKQKNELEGGTETHAV